ncbi:MAG: hypothetical protein NTY53_18430 [Kiritimatiellaeota bacterium]|nr:hypothetical protein [Kiritimatiellota bacterium]
MNKKSRRGIAMLAVMATMTVLFLMWSVAFREINAAVSVEMARMQRGRYEGGPLQATALALDRLTAGLVHSGASTFRTSVTTEGGTFSYVVTFVMNQDSGGKAGSAKTTSTCSISVAPANGSIDDSLPEL